MKVGVFIGRMQPMHNGHLEVIKTIAEQCDGIVIGVGSANKARSTKNPFLDSERITLIQRTIHGLPINKAKAIGSTVPYRIIGLPDFTYNDPMWLETATNLIEMEAAHINMELGTDIQKLEIVLFGHDQGADTEYLHQFPQWGKELLPKSYNFHATDVRRNLFYDINTEWESKVPTKVSEAIKVFRDTPKGKTVFSNLIAEAELVKKIKADKAKYRYPIIDVTVDAVVVCNGHLLMVTRGVNPGKGQLALPGGYLNEFESIPAGIIRELREETKIDIKPSLLRNLLNDERIKCFSAPGRSVRGRILTHCGLINYHSNTLPEIKGSDDAVKAEWIPLSKLDSLARNIFEDHYCIIRNMLGYC